jgi:hypothetical protein
MGNVIQADLDYNNIAIQKLLMGIAVINIEMSENKYICN